MFGESFVNHLSHVQLPIGKDIIVVFQFNVQATWKIRSELRSSIQISITQYLNHLIQGRYLFKWQIPTRKAIEHLELRQGEVFHVPLSVEAFQIVKSSLICDIRGVIEVRVFLNDQLIVLSDLNWRGFEVGARVEGGREAKERVRS